MSESEKKSEGEQIVVRVELTERERQLVLMAMAALGLEARMFDDPLGKLACKFGDDAWRMYDTLKKFRSE